MEWQKCYCVAIAVSVAGVAAAGVSAYSSSQQSAALSKAGQTAANDPAGAYGTKVKPAVYNNTVNLPNYNEGAGANDYANNIPMLNTIAAKNTAESQTLRNKVSGGQASTVFNQEGGDINALLKGSVNKDVLDEVNRQVAARSGGAFMPGGGSGQQASDDFARSIGQTSTQMMEAGLSAAPQWEGLANAFTYTPQQAANDSLNWMRARNDYTLGAAQIANTEDEQVYQAQQNYNTISASPNPQVAGGINTSLQLSALQGQQTTNQTNALLGAIKGAGGIYTGATASAGGTGGVALPYGSVAPTNSGIYMGGTTAPYANPTSPYQITTPGTVNPQNYYIPS